MEFIELKRRKLYIQFTSRPGTQKYSLGNIKLFTEITLA